MMRLYGLLLYLFPASFRNEYGDEMAAVFRRRLSETANPLAAAGAWIKEIADVLATACEVHWDILLQDLRYSIRTLTRDRGFTLTAIIVTGLGIGANTAAFSITDNLLLRPLSFYESDRLVQLWHRTPGYSQLELSPPNYKDWREAASSFETTAAYTGDVATFAGNGEPQRLESVRATAEFFEVLRINPAMGRIFTNAEATKTGGPVVISHGFWQTVLGGDPGVLGQGIRLDGEIATIVGVMPGDFFFPARGVQIWRPLFLDDPLNDLRDNFYLNAIARLKPGVSLQQARSEMDAIAANLSQRFPADNENVGANVIPLRDLIPRQTQLLLWALFGASFCVLLIGCTNLANLLLAKAMSRRKELSVRLAIGAGRERVVRQLLTESALLAIAGGVAGVVLAIVILPLLAQLVPPRLPLADITVLDRRVFAFAGLVTLVTAIGFGVLPALRMCRGVDNDDLRQGSRSALGGRRERLRTLLVAAEIAASVVLLISSGLLIRALWRVQAIDPGFRTDSVLAVQTWLPLPRYNSGAVRNRFYAEVLANVRALPGVTGAGLISFLPMNGSGGIWPIAVAGNTDATEPAAIRQVSPGYFAAMQMPLIAGRDISDSDTLQSPPVVVVSESFANRYWPNQNAIGRTFHFDFNFPFAQLERTIVGIVRDVRFRGLEGESEPQVYLAYQQFGDDIATFYAPKELVVRSSVDGASLAEPIRAIIQRADPEMPISRIRPLSDVIDLQTAPRSTQLRLVGAFATLSILLTAVGIHGLLSFAVGQRRPEFGLRIALGAQRRNIFSMVLREALLLAALGTLPGFLLSFYVSQSMQGLLAGLPPSDPITLATAAVVAFLMTLSGSLMPAIRATRADPTAAIRGD